jgi:hypothetical protein
MARDCAHYGRWLVLKQAMLIHVDLDPEDDEKEHLDYIAMLIESKTSSSDYSSNSSKWVFALCSRCRGAKGSA